MLTVKTPKNQISQVYILCNFSPFYASHNWNPLPNNRYDWIEAEEQAALIVANMDTNMETAAGSA